MNIAFRILLALFLLQAATTNGEVLLSTLNNRQNSPPLYATIGNYFGEYRIGSVVIQTGKNPDGYTLNSVSIIMDDASGSPVNFYGAIIDLSNDRLVDLIGSSTPRRAGRYTYRPESRYFLKSNTEYLFSVHAPFNAWNNHFALSVTTADERVRSSDGWRINYTFLASRFIGGEPELIGAVGVPLIAIDATKITPPKPTPPPLSGNATLRSLALSGVPLNFASNRYQYSASVSHTTASTTVTASPNEPAARVSISPNDANTNSAGHQVRLTEGNNTIVVTVIAPNGNRRTYTIVVRRVLPPLSGDATLRSLALSGVPINFASNRYQYSATVSHPTFSTTVTAIANEPKASVSIVPADADAATSGHQVALAEGNNAIVVTVTAPNGNSRAYTVTIRRALSTPTPLPPPTLPMPTPQPEPFLSIRKTGNLVEIRWSGGTLQHATAIDGPWKDVHVSSPLRQPLLVESSEFFRLKSIQESVPPPSPPPFETR